jgi:alpha-1,6-mannosyltransferase
MMEPTGLGWRLGALAAGLFMLTVGGAVAQWNAEHAIVGLTAIVQAPLYLAAAWLIIPRPEVSGRTSRALVSILLVGAAMRLVVIAAPPVSSDIYRYIWDGRVQAAGINPYRYVPADQTLLELRDDVIYPQINRADYAPTIYPPAAQIVFLAVTRVSESATAMKVAMTVFEGLAVWAVIQLLLERGLPPTRIALYVWHPLPVWEFAGSGHLDIIAIAFLLLAFVAVDRRWSVAAGFALSAGVLVKIFPLIAGPALYKRWDWRLPAAFIAGIAILYGPYLSAGPKMFGFLGGYVAEEGFTNGTGIFLWSLISAIAPVPQRASTFYLPVAAVILFAMAIGFLFRRPNTGGDLLASTTLIFALLCLISPHYPWYFAWLIPFLCFYPFVAGLYLTCAASYLHLSHWPPNLWEGGLIYGVTLVLLLAEFVYRYRREEALRDSTLAA